MRAVAAYWHRGLDSGASSVRPLTPESVLTTVRSTPGVGVAEGSGQGLVTVIGNERQGAQPEAGAHPRVQLVSGRASSSSLIAAQRPGDRRATNEFTIDSGTAKSSTSPLGDQVTVIANNPRSSSPWSASPDSARADNLAGATLVTFDTATAQRLFGKPGYFTEIDVDRGPGHDRGPADQRHQRPAAPRLRGGDRGRRWPRRTPTSSSTFVGVFNTFLLVFAGIALFVGAFLIFNTFSILVGQRTRELALLRAIGASRRQVTTSVMAEAVFIGLVGLGRSAWPSACRSPLACTALLDGLGLGLRRRPCSCLPRTIIVALDRRDASSRWSPPWYPPIRASKVRAGRRHARRRHSAPRLAAPARAVRRRSCWPSGRGARCRVVRPRRHRPSWVLGAAITFLGVAILVPFIASPLARVIGAPLTLTGVTGQLAGRTRPATRGGRRPPPPR